MSSVKQFRLGTFKQASYMQRLLYNHVFPLYFWWKLTEAVKPWSISVRHEHKQACPFYFTKHLISGAIILVSVQKSYAG